MGLQIARQAYMSKYKRGKLWLFIRATRPTWHLANDNTLELPMNEPIKLANRLHKQTQNKSLKNKRYNIPFPQTQPLWDAQPTICSGNVACCQLLTVKRCFRIYVGRPMVILSWLGLSVRGLHLAVNRQRLYLLFSKFYVKAWCWMRKVWLTYPRPLPVGLHRVGLYIVCLAMLGMVNCHRHWSSQSISSRGTPVVAYLSKLIYTVNWFVKLYLQRQLTEKQVFKLVHCGTQSHLKIVKLQSAAGIVDL